MKIMQDKQFYIRALRIAVPMILQSIVTTFVSLIDNIMVGSVGTAQMSGVSIVNQLMFVFNITIFGAVSGPSIFGTQFFGKEDAEGQKYTFRFRLILSAVMIGLFAIVFHLFGSELISLFISGDAEDEKLLTDTLIYGKKYLDIMIISLIPFGFGQAYSSVVRECGETKIPMLASFAAIGINIFLDYGLIFGKFGMPEMGVAGAAIATVAAKFIEALIVIVWAHVKTEKNLYIVGLFKGFYMPLSLCRQMIIKGFPLLLNEFLWSFGMSLIAQCYSVRGIDVVAARNIASTLVNIFTVVFTQLGAAIGIIVGAELGAGKMETARISAKKLTGFSVVVSAVLAIIMIPIAFVFPEIYNTEKDVKELASYYIIIQAVAMPLWSYTNACYFTLRSGGKTGITFLFDFLYTWIIMIPLAFILSRYTNMEIHWLLAIVTYSEIIKVIVGHYMVKSGMWINNIVDKN